MSQPSYQVLARKYRPNNFHELVGQTHVSKALINAIDHNRLHHAYLFTGTRGVGKTTIARILSKCLNCDTGVTSKPCGTCNSCQMIEQGRFIDLIEIDAASRTKVEDTRELLDNVPYAPTQGRYKVYLIDEVHMLSTHSFNALLKTLEEPPEHVKFLLATTDPQKLPITVISRCLQFVLRPLAQQQLTDHLRKLLTLENVPFEESALWQLAHSAKGSVRDSLSLTDQAIAFGQGELTEHTVNDMLGLINGADLIALIADICNDNKTNVAHHIEQMRMQMVDASSVFDELSDVIHKIALMQVLPTVGLNVNESQAQALRTIAEHISSDVLQLYYEIVVKSRENIALATTPMQALEMCLLRMLAFRPLPMTQMVKPIEPTPIEPTPIEQTPIEPTPIEQTPIEQTPIEQTPIEQTPIEQTPIEPNPIEQTPIEPNPIEPNPIEPNPIEPNPIEPNPIEPNPIEPNPIEPNPIEPNPIEPNPIEPNPIEPNPIEPNPIEPNPIEQPSVLITDDDPRTLLKCAPQELRGEWTVEKWDYWVQIARDKQLLDKDELAFARQGLMIGECDGKSIFHTGLKNEKFRAQFINISEELNSQFLNASYELESASQSTKKTLTDDIPQSRQKQRQHLAQTTAIQKLSESPVMKLLNEKQQAVIKTIKLI